MTAPAYRQRRSIRLKGYDYALPGAYFITFCTYQRLPLFGDVVNGEMRLSVPGHMAQSCWNALPDHFAHIKVDAFVVMPNHVHAVLWIKDVGARHVGATHASPLRRSLHARPAGPPPQSIGAIVGALKSSVTRRINALQKSPRSSIWQRNYYDHIIRDDAELDRIRTYIQENPANWHDDEDNPANRQRKR